MLLADEFFFLSHDDVSGRPRINPVVVNLGLSAALVAELMFDAKLTTHQGSLHVVEPTPPGEPLARATLEVILREPREHPIRTWLSFFARTVEDAVGRRLVRTGYARREESRRMLRQAVAYVPVDPHLAASPGVSLSTRLRWQEPMKEPSTVLAGLASATGLDRFLLDGAPPSAAEHLRQLLGGLPAPFRELLAHTRTAVGEAVLTHRT